MTKNIKLSSVLVIFFILLSLLMLQPAHLGLAQSPTQSPISVIQNVVPFSTTTDPNPNERNTIPDILSDRPSTNLPISPAITGINFASILPFLKWIGIAFVVVGGLFLLWKILTREKTVYVTPQPPPLPTIETLDPIPGWFKELKDNNTSGYFDRKNPNIELQETILIGLGLVGRNVLERIIAGLNTHFGDSWRSKIRIIQVDVDLQMDRHSSEWQIPSGLRQAEWVLLKPELTEIQERLRKNPQDWEHLHWYEQTAPVYPRSKSRMALFYDLRDGPSSQLWNAVETAYYELDKPLVRVIGSTFDSVGSGLLADMAFLVKQGITRRNADVEMWLLGPSREEWSESPNPGRLSPSEQVMRTLAALRELERFQRNSNVTFQYVPPTSNFTQLNQTYDYAVIPTVFFFDPASKNLRFSEMMREMSHVLMSLLYEKTARSLSLHLSATRVQAVGKSVACGIGHVEVRLSSGLLEEAVAWRMVKDVLFEEAMGLFPLERIHSNGEYQPLRDFSPTPSLNVLHEQETVKRWIIYVVKTGDQRRLFNNISARLGQILNGEPAVATSDFIQGRRMALDKAERWLRLLTNTLKMYPEIQIVQKINKLQDQLAVLQSWLVNDVSALALSRWNEARANLKKLRAASDFETDIPPDLEWSAYKEYIMLNEAQISQYTDQSPLLKVASRFGWHVHFDENEKEWRLNLILPPTDFSWNEGSRPDAYAIPVSASEFLDSLFKLALPFAQMEMGHSAVERANTLDVNDWKDRVRPMLRYEELEASRLMGSLTHKHILGISEGLSPRESKELTEKVSSFIKPIDVVDTGDRSVAHFLHAVNWIPFESMDIYNNDQWTFNTVLPSYYVWPLEQWASSIETDSSHRLSVSFLTRFNRYKKFMKVFGLGLIYDLFTFEPNDGWIVPFADNDWKRIMPYRNPHLAASLMDMFFTEREYETQKEKCMIVWNALIEDRRSALKDSAYGFFRNFEQTKLKIYFQNDGDDAKAERDMGVFLSYLLQEEKQLCAK